MAISKMKKLSHVNSKGGVMMVNIGNKPNQQRRAIAAGEVRMNSATIQLLKKKALPKGDVLTAAQIAGIQAAKRTDELIPLCHSLPLNEVEVTFTLKKDRVWIQTKCCCDGKTGVEMEALTAVSVVALTLYDMCKAVDKKMVISNIRLIRKEKL